MKPATQPVPPGFHTVTASLTVSNAAEAIEFYKKALGAEEIMRMTGPDGKIGHAELKIGDSIVFLNDEMSSAPGCPRSPLALGGSTGSVYLYVEDVDKSHERAVSAGGKSNMPVMDMFWGDRFGGFTDPFGHQWGIATHTRDLSPEEIEEGAKAFWAEMAQMAQKKSA